MESNTEWITRQQAASRAGVNLRTIDNWTRTGVVTKHVDGVGRTWIDGAELDELLKPVPVVDSPAR
jgi:phage terminase Nu1 subunit (DNA packaging protein)